MHNALYLHNFFKNLLYISQMNHSVSHADFMMLKQKIREIQQSIAEYIFVQQNLHIYIDMQTKIQTHKHTY